MKGEFKMEKHKQEKLKTKEELLKPLLKNYTKLKGEKIYTTVNEDSWTLPELFIRQELNNGCDGFGMRKVNAMYDYIKANKEHFIAHNMIGKKGGNNVGFELWDDYMF